MRIVSLIVFPSLLIMLALGMMFWHWQSWLKHLAAKPDDQELDFRRRQMRRRLQASCMLAVIGLGMMVGQRIPGQRFPSLFVFFWCSVTALVVWMMLLALADAIATRSYANRQKQHWLVEQTRLHHELKRDHGHRHNGQK